MKEKQPKYDRLTRTEKRNFIILYVLIMTNIFIWAVRYSEDQSNRIEVRTNTPVPTLTQTPSGIKLPKIW